MYLATRSLHNLQPILSLQRAKNTPKNTPKAAPSRCAAYITSPPGSKGAPANLFLVTCLGSFPNWPYMSPRTFQGTMAQRGSIPRMRAVGVETNKAAPTPETMPLDPMFPLVTRAASTSAPPSPPLAGDERIACCMLMADPRFPPASEPAARITTDQGPRPDRNAMFNR